MKFGNVRDRMRHLQRAMRDPKLSLAAKGYFAYIIAFPKKWNLGDIVDNAKVSPKEAHAAFRELIKHGYIVVKHDGEPPS